MFQNGQSHLYGLIAQQRENSLTVGATTDNVPEGSSHLYFTSARARSVYTVQSPLNYVQSTGTLSLPVATGSTNGYLSSTDWNTFNNKANSFTGYTGTVSVRKGDDTGSLTMTFSNGILINAV